MRRARLPHHFGGHCFGNMNGADNHPPRGRFKAIPLRYPPAKLRQKHLVVFPPIC